MEILPEPRWSQVIGEPRIGEPHAIALAANDIARHPAADCRQLPFELANSGLTGIVAYQPHPGPRRDRDRFRTQAMGGYLLWQQVLPADLDLFLFAVARNLDDFHAVAQRTRHRGHAVRRGEKENMREVIRQVEKMIDEGPVLLRIEHFQHG